LGPFQFEDTLTRAVDDLAGGIFDDSNEEVEVRVAGEDAEDNEVVNLPLIA